MAGTTHGLEKSLGPTFCPQRVSFIRLGVLAVEALESPWNSDASIGNYRHRKTGRGIVNQGHSEPESLFGRKQSWMEGEWKVRSW